MPKKMNNETFKEKLLKQRGTEYSLIGNYERSNKKTLFKHNTCGHIWSTKPELMVRNTDPVGCPICSRNIRTTESFNDEIGDDYELLSDFKTVHNKVKIKHLKCGHIWSTKPSNFLNGTRCPYCANRKTQAEFESEVLIKYNGEYSVIGKYINMDTKVEVLHTVCNQTYETTPSNLLGSVNRKGRGCPYCYGTFKKTTKEFKQEVDNLVGNEYKILGKYNGKDKPILIKHETCGHEYMVRPSNFLNGTRCPKCLKYKKDIEVFDFIKSIYSGEVLLSTREILPSKKEIDIYIPEFKLGIEFDGLYWHSDIYKDKNYHISKTNEALDEGIHLIHIFEDEWINKRKIVEGKLKHKLGLNNDLEKIYARKCEIREIDTLDKNKFLNKNHIQGKDISKIKIGLYYNNTLVSVMTFNRTRPGISAEKNDKVIYELVRFANTNDKLVIGSFGKLLKYFTRNYKNIDEIKTYADIRWSRYSDNVYGKNNFTLSHISKPNYWYTSRKKRFHRYGFRKNILEKKFPSYFKENLTEFQIMDSVPNTYRIWDCGNLVYILKLS